MCHTSKGESNRKINYFIAGSLEAAYSLNWGAREIFGERVEGRPWPFYDN